jgi:uncharacterized membrane protein
MKGILIAVGMLLYGGLAQAQTTPPLVCYGNEPSWTLDLGDGSARLILSGEEDADYAGRATALPHLKVQAWRGRPSGGRAGDLVALVTEAPCSDGMSDAKRPFTARVSLADGRLLAGCCRPGTLVTTGVGSASEPGGAGGVALGSAPVTAPMSATGPADWGADLEQYLPAMRSCTFEALRTEAVVFAERRPNQTVHLVLRLADKRYADCEAPPYGPARVIPRGKNSRLSPAEQAVVLTLLPGQPPRGSCDRTEPALDDKGSPFAWITRKGC